MKPASTNKWVLLVLGLLLSMALAACQQAAPAAPAEKEPAAEEPAAQPAAEEPKEEEAAEAPAASEETAAEINIFDPSTVPGKKPGKWTDEMSDCSGVAKEPPWTIGVTNVNVANSWRVQMMKELEFAASQNPDIEELIVTNADGDVSKQIADMEDLLARGVDAMLILPTSPDGIVPTVEDVYNSGTVTIVFNSEVETDKLHSILWIDEFKFGYIGGKWLNDKLGGKGNVVMLEGIPGLSVSDDRTNGAKAAFDEGIKVLAQQPASWAYDQAKVVMEDFIAAYPQIDGVYSQGGAMSLAAIEALEAAGRPVVPVPGEGYNGFLKYWAEHKKDGFSSVGPDEPTWQSAAALDVAIRCLKGETVEKWTELPLPVITDDNVEEYARFDCPDEVWANTKMTPEKITELYQCSKSE